MPILSFSIINMVFVEDNNSCVSYPDFSSRSGSHRMISSPTLNYGITHVNSTIYISAGTGVVAIAFCRLFLAFIICSALELDKYAWNRKVSQFGTFYPPVTTIYGYKSILGTLKIVSLFLWSTPSAAMNRTCKSGRQTLSATGRIYP